MKYFKHTINDEIWNIYLTDKENIASLYDNESVHAAAFVEPRKKEIYFDQAEINLAIIRHELTHVAFHYLFLADTSIEYNDLEEIFCEFIAHRLDWLTKLINDVSSKLEDLKKDAKND